MTAPSNWVMPSCRPGSHRRRVQRRTRRSANFAERMPWCTSGHLRTSDTPNVCSILSKTGVVALDDGDPQSSLGKRAGAMFAGRARAEDDDVVVAQDGARRRAAPRACTRRTTRAIARQPCPVSSRARRVRPRRVRARCRSSSAELKVAVVASMRPGSRLVISCSCQRLPSGSVNSRNDA